MQDFTIRRMRRADLDIAIAWAADEGWNPGLLDAECYWQTDPDGFLIGDIGGSAEPAEPAETAESAESAEPAEPAESAESAEPAESAGSSANGAVRQPIAMISALRYGAHFGFMGFYMVASHLRGQGYGMQLWNEGLRHLAGRTIGLDGVVAQQANYQRSGFELAYRNIRFEGTGTDEQSTQPAIVDIKSLPIVLLQEYEAPFFPEPRPQFLHAWVNAPGHQALCYYQQGIVRGYGVIRRCRTGHKIGPLCADTPQIAHELYAALCGRIGNGIPVYLDVPEKNAAAVSLAERYRMTRVFETARMYRGVPPDIDISRLYSVTSFEIG